MLGLLPVLAERPKSKLTPYEERFLILVLNELRMRVIEVGKGENRTITPEPPEVTVPRRLEAGDAPV